MLENLFQTFGVMGALTISLVVFLIFVFWVAGIAGFTDSQSGNLKPFQIALCVLFPPFPVVWLITDMVRQHRAMRQP